MSNWFRLNSLPDVSLIISSRIQHTISTHDVREYLDKFLNCSTLKKSWTLELSSSSNVLDYLFLMYLIKKCMTLLILVGIRNLTCIWQYTTIYYNIKIVQNQMLFKIRLNKYNLFLKYQPFIIYKYVKRNNISMQDKTI